MPTALQDIAYNSNLQINYSSHNRRAIRWLQAIGLLILGNLPNPMKRKNRGMAFVHTSRVRVALLDFVKEGGELRFI